MSLKQQVMQLKRSKYKDNKDNNISNKNVNFLLFTILHYFYKQIRIVWVQIKLGNCLNNDEKGYCDEICNEIYSIN